MKYYAAVWQSPEGFSAEVPDLPGAITEADSFEALVANLVEAASGWLEVAADHHEPIPAPSSVEALRRNPHYADCLWVTVEVEIERPGT